MAFLILSGIQYYLIQNTYRYKISAFQEEVKDKAFSIGKNFSRFDSIKSIGSRKASIIAAQYYAEKISKEDLVDSIFALRNNDTLNTLLVLEFQKEMGDKDIEYGCILNDYILVDTITKELDTIFSKEDHIDNQLFGSLKTLKDAIQINSGTSTGNWMDRHESHLYSASYFMSISKWKQKVLQRMWSLIALSVFILLSVISLFIYTLRSWLQQKKINDVKNDFINNITHEFKTPLTTLSIASKTLRNSKVKSNDTMYYNTLNSIDRQNIRLQKLIDQVMTKSLGSTDMRLTKSSVEGQLIFNEIIDDFLIAIENSNVEINRKFVGEGLIKLDRFYMTTAISNILENAVKYGSNKIDVNITKNKSDCHITITDNGMGISKKDQGEIFEKFYRVSTGDRHDVKGLGLGLYYTKSIIEAHNGSIEVESFGKDRGTTFNIKLKNAYL